MAQDLVLAVGHMGLELAWANDARSVKATVLITLDWAFAWTSLRRWRIFFIVISSVGILVDVVVKSSSKLSFW